MSLADVFRVCKKDMYTKFEYLFITNNKAANNRSVAKFFFDLEEKETQCIAKKEKVFSEFLKVYLL